MSQTYNKKSNCKQPDSFIFVIIGTSQNFRKSKCGKTSCFWIVFVAIIIICCIKGFPSFKIDNQTLYNKIVNHFFSKELRDPNFEPDRHLCFRKILPDCCCLKNCRYYGTCCIDALFNNNIKSVEEYVEIFLDRTKIRKYI